MTIPWYPGFQEPLQISKSTDAQVSYKKWPGTMNIMGCICGLCLWDLTNHRCGTWKPGGMSILPYICIVLCSLKNASHSLSPYKFATAKSLQSCPILCNHIDGSPPGSPVPGILQARTLEWVAISFSNAWKWKVKVKSLSCVQLLATPWTAAHQPPPPMGFSRQEY